MKYAARNYKGALGILLVTFLLIGCWEGAYVTQKLTTSGTVTAKDNDAAGKVTSVEIKTDTEPGIVVENSGKGKELIGMIGKKVEASGMVRGSAEKKLIKVESYKVLE